MQNVKFIDNQWVTQYVVQMWFKFFGNNFHVAGTKTDLDSLQWDLRKLAQARFQRYEKWRKPPRVWSLFLVKRERITAASSESVSTQFLQPITARIGDYAYQYSQYGISSTLGYTIPVPVTLIFFWPESIFMGRFTSESSCSNEHVRPILAAVLFRRIPASLWRITGLIASEDVFHEISCHFRLPPSDGRNIGRGVCPCCCLFSSGMVTSPFTSQSSVTRTSRQGPLRSPPCLADVLQGDVFHAA